MMPKLFTQSETTFNHNGIGVLTDCLSCYITEELNCKYELTMEYAADGIHWDAIVPGFIILAKPNHIDNPQPFRIYSVKRTMYKSIVVKANHVSYDLSGYPVSPFSAMGISAATQAWNDHQVIDHPFVLLSNIPPKAIKYDFETPKSSKSILEHFTKTTNGELKFDRFNVHLLENRGSDKGFYIRYGKNLSSIKIEKSAIDKYSGVYPYWMGFSQDINSEEMEYIELEEKVVFSPYQSNDQKVLPVDFSNKFETAPSTQALKDAALNYIQDNAQQFAPEPYILIDLSYVDFLHSLENDNIANDEEPSIGDIIHVILPQFNVSVATKVVKAKYNVLMDTNESISVGNIKKNIADTVAEQQKSINATRR